MNRKQIIVFFSLLLVNAFSAFAIYAFFPQQLTANTGVPMPK